MKMLKNKRGDDSEFCAWIFAVIVLLALMLLPYGDAFNKNVFILNIVIFIIAYIVYEVILIKKTKIKGFREFIGLNLLLLLGAAGTSFAVVGIMLWLRFLWKPIKESFGFLTGNVYFHLVIAAIAAFVLFKYVLFKLFVKGRKFDKERRMRKRK